MNTLYLWISLGLAEASHWTVSVLIKFLLPELMSNVHSKLYKKLFTHICIYNFVVHYGFGLHTLGWALWNWNSFEFKFDDTRLSSYYENKIGGIEIFFGCILTLQSQDATKNVFNGANLILILWGKSCSIIKFEFKTTLVS